MTASDKAQFATSDKAREAAEEIVEMAGFGDRQDVYRLAVAAALVKGLDPAPEDVGGRKTYLGTGSFDPDGWISATISQSREDGRERPYALAERLAEAGIADLHAHLNKGHPIREYLAGLSESAKQA
jgi:hypothetical protein